MLVKRFNFPVIAVIVIISSAGTYLIKEYLHQKIHQITDQTIAKIDTQSGIGHNKMARLNGYRLIKPLIYSEEETESSSFSNIKSQLITYIKQLKNSQKLISASVYIIEFDHGEWMCINDTENYYPGSLIKVPGMITYLKMAEKNPSLLNKKIAFNTPNSEIPNQTFGSKQIVAGKEYTIRELLKYMVSYSDNNATYLLNSQVDLSVFRQVFSDLNIPSFTKNNSTITAKNLSTFLKVLYNGSYLSRDNSEFALELLQGCNFKLGMIKGVPVNIIVAHKFGEMGDSTSRQLHESGLVYIDGNPYLLTIMTKGYSTKDLPEILGTISKMVYQDIISKGTN